MPPAALSLATEQLQRLAMGANADHGSRWGIKLEQVTAVDVAGHAGNGRDDADALRRALDTTQ